MFSERIERLTGSLIREIPAAAQRPEVISFAGGLPAPQCLPELDFSGVPQALAQYGTTEGEPELRELIAEQARAIGVPCSANQVLILSGSQQAIDLTAKLFIDPGTPVVTEGPTYLATMQAYGLFGADITAVPQENGELNPASLAAAFERVKPRLTYLIPSFQNPSGACYSAATRQALAEVIDAAGVPVLEDDPYRELSYDGVAPAPLVSHLKSAPWIYSGSFSKTLAPGLRVGYLIASPDLYPYLVKLKQAMDLHTNRIGQWFMAKWLKSPDYPQHLTNLRATYKVGRDAMQAALEKHFADLADWQMPKGGLFFWLTLKKPQDTREVLKRALEQNVAFMPGEPFYPDPNAGIGHLRLNFSHTAPERIDEGIARLAALIRG
ncbi:aminotransferase-like domain-containing protein [Paludibacterium denitrificans]|uniref:Putative 8-amino-7-oxononanoate synthase n=1 Tax=Paludibacterium denitrificans TaxID=2675226 RepID=A0A844GAU1_9NEIS|nr:PLP-dependent aminotransferase family protein [Paludibacterium denitrificans]MTD32759.1 aminotransferase class I/II-fold pyridoxal phosphate-dependent enzyme [Paludibacterium denitrificans]